MAPSPNSYISDSLNSPWLYFLNHYKLTIVTVSPTVNNPSLQYKDQSLDKSRKLLQRLQAT